LLARLPHPHVLQVFDANLLDKSPFLAIEFLDGQALRHHIAPQKPLPTAEAVGAPPASRPSRPRSSPCS
jgi:hypothetical protein